MGVQTKLVYLFYEKANEIQILDVAKVTFNLAAALCKINGNIKMLKFPNKEIILAKLRASESFAYEDEKGILNVVAEKFGSTELIDEQLMDFYLDEIRSTKSAWKDNLMNASFYAIKKSLKNLVVAE